MDYLLVVGDECFTNNFILKVQIQFAIVRDVEKELGDVARKHLTSVVRYLAGDIGRTENGDSVCNGCFVGLGQFTIATTLSSQVDHNGSVLHLLDCSRCK